MHWAGLVRRGPRGPTAAQLSPEEHAARTPTPRCCTRHAWIGTAQSVVGMGESLAWGLRHTRAAAAETLATARAGPGSDAARQLPLRLPTHTTTVEVDDVVRALLLVRAQGKAVLGPVLMEPLRGAPKAHEERAPVLTVLWLCVL